MGSVPEEMIRSVDMVMDRAFAGETPPTLSATVTLNEDVPVPVGVPLMTPVAAFSVKPAGSDPLLTVQLLYGGIPPVAPNVWE